jgi:hypothetical protein
VRQVFLIGFALGLLSASAHADEKATIKVKATWRAQDGETADQIIAKASKVAHFVPRGWEVDKTGSGQEVVTFSWARQINDKAGDEYTIYWEMAADGTMTLDPPYAKPMELGWQPFALSLIASEIADEEKDPNIGFLHDLSNFFLIVRIDRRDLVWINVTTNPTAEWIARQITEAFPWDDAPGYMIRDRDRIYGAVVTRRLRAMGIRDKPIVPALPWQNGFAERLIGSIRRECLDHAIICGEAHLRRVLKSYADYYNRFRTHRSLKKDAPVSRSVQRTGVIRSRAILGGLHHHYGRI